MRFSTAIMENIQRLLDLKINCHMVQSSTTGDIPKYCTARMQNDVCILMFIAGLFMVSKTWRQPVCSPVGQRACRVNAQCVTSQLQIRKLCYWQEHEVT